MFFELSLTTAVIVTVLGIIYLLTIGRLTDIIPFLGFGDDVLVILLIISMWALVFIASLLENPIVWVVLIIIGLAIMEGKYKLLTKLLGKK